MELSITLAPQACLHLEIKVNLEMLARYLSLESEYLALGQTSTCNREWGRWGRGVVLFNV